MPASPSSEHLNAAEFRAPADDVFGRIASRYDLLCDLFSFWIHRYWKRQVAKLIASKPQHEWIDSATGTGDIVLRVLKRQTSGAAHHIVAADISPQMLAIAKQRLASVAGSVELRQLDAHSMPAVPTESVDLYSISFGLKICNRKAVLQEALRVLRPGGCLIVLEASNIPIRWLHQAYLRYMSVCLPVIGWLATGGDASAYRYLLHGIREFPGAEALAEEIRQSGFVETTFERLSLGIVAIHTGYKPDTFDASVLK
jgi:ubiquinone/menaquinone biosynthesis methyltransferase